MKTIPLFLLLMLGVMTAAEPAPPTTATAPAAKKAKGGFGYPPEFSGAQVVNYKIVGDTKLGL